MFFNVEFWPLNAISNFSKINTFKNIAKKKRRQVAWNLCFWNIWRVFWIDITSIPMHQIKLGAYFFIKMLMAGRLLFLAPWTAIFQNLKILTVGLQALFSCLLTPQNLAQILYLTSRRLWCKTDFCIRSLREKFQTCTTLNSKSLLSKGVNLKDTFANLPYKFMGLDCCNSQKLPKQKPSPKIKTCLASTPICPLQTASKIKNFQTFDLKALALGLIEVEKQVLNKAKVKPLGGQSFDV